MTNLVNCKYIIKVKRHRKSKSKRQLIQLGKRFRRISRESTYFEEDTFQRVLAEDTYHNGTKDIEILINGIYELPCRNNLYFRIKNFYHVVTTE